MELHVLCDGSALCGVDSPGQVLRFVSPVIEYPLLQWDEHIAYSYDDDVRQVGQSGNSICADCDEIARRWLALKQETPAPLIITKGTNRWHNREVQGDWSSRYPHLANDLEKLRPELQNSDYFTHLDTISAPRARSEFYSYLHELAVHHCLTAISGSSVRFTADLLSSSDLIASFPCEGGQVTFAVECKAVLDGQRMKEYAANGDEKTLLQSLALEIFAVQVPGWKVSIEDSDGQIFNSPMWQSVEEAIQGRIQNLSPSSYTHHIKTGNEWWGLPELRLKLKEETGQEAAITVAFLPEESQYYPSAGVYGRMEPSLIDKIREALQKAQDQHCKSKDKHLPLIVALCAEDEDDSSIEAVLYGKWSGYYLKFAEDGIPTWRNPDGVWSYPHTENGTTASPVGVLWSTRVGGKQTLYVPPTSQVWWLEALMKQIPTRYVNQQICEVRIT